MLLLCVFGLMGVAPRSALAALSVPMCSSYSECAEAPIPDAPPTGGEMRAPRRNPFELGPSLDPSPSRDPHPTPAQLAQLEPLSLVPVRLVLFVVAYDVCPFGASPNRCIGRDLVSEVFRPPC